MVRRLNKLNSLLEEIESDSLLLTDLKNIRYFVNFSGSSGSLLVTNAGNFFFTDGRYKIQAEEEVLNAKVIVCKNMVEALESTISELCVKSVAFEANDLSYSQWQKFCEKIKTVEFYPLKDQIDRLRLLKDDKEVELIKAGATIAKEAFFSVIALIRPGMKEIDVALELEVELRKRGAEKTSFDIIVASGERSALPHAMPSDKEIVEGDLVVVDFGVIIDGYHTDETCTLRVGKVNEELCKIYEVVDEAQKLAIDSVAPGVKAKEIDSAARKHINQCGYGEYFGHGTGHGVGLGVHELPSINEKSEMLLEEGMVFTIEPGIYLPQKGGVRIEDMVIVTESGSEILTQCNSRLRG